MRCLIAKNVKFYMLDAGESYPDPHSDNRYAGAYAVFPFDGKWRIQTHKNPRWVDLTPDAFDTENAAFNYAYSHFLKK